MKVGARGDMSTKIVLGDWCWHPNRRLSSPQTSWHFPNDKHRKMNMLFADGHAQLFEFPPSHEEAPIKDSFYWDPEHPENTDTGIPPDPSRGYW
jgi:prepilin-type processing-associated H-X9-DG protein